MQGYEIEKIDFFEGFDGKLIRYGIYGNKNHKKVVALFQGRAECFEKYSHIIDFLVGLKYLVFLMDWRGQGGSVRELVDKDKGYVADFLDYQKDLNIFFTKIIKPYLDDSKLDIIAHSMGGHNLMRFAMENQNSFINKMLLCSPMLGINTAPFPLSVAELIAFGAVKTGFGSHYVPGAGKYKEIDFKNNPLTSNYDLFRKNQAFLRKNRDLALGGATFSWLFNALKSIRVIENNYKKNNLNIDIKIIYGAADKVVCINKIKKACHDLGLKIFEIKDARHEIMMENKKILEVFYKELSAFFKV